MTPDRTVKGLKDTYRIVAELTGGGFGLTFKAERQSDGREVLLKELRFERLGEWKALELFEREAKVLHSLSHTGIPEYHDYFASDGERAFNAGELLSGEGQGDLSFIIVQAYIAGPTLHQVIQEGARFTTDELLAIFRNLLAVLDYLHTLSPPVIHRDIKPANIILDRENVPHLVDFGAIQDRLKRETQLGSTSVGTFGYIPLEQMMGKARAASDLYALGMTMLAAITHLEPEELPVDDATGKIRLEALGHIPEPFKVPLDAMTEPIIGNRVPSARAVLELLDNPGTVSPTRTGAPPSPDSGAAEPGVAEAARELNLINRRKLTRLALFLNAIFPGSGSILLGRYWQGTIQSVVVLISASVLFLFWKDFGDREHQPFGFLLGIAILASWFWAFIMGYKSLLRLREEEEKEEGP